MPLKFLPLITASILLLVFNFCKNSRIKCKNILKQHFTGRSSSTNKFVRHYLELNRNFHCTWQESASQQPGE